MDLSNYRKLKETGALQVVRTGGTFALLLSRYDQTTGQPIDPEMAPLRVDQVDLMIAENQKIVDNLSALREDMVKISAEAAAETARRPSS